MSSPDVTDADRDRDPAGRPRNARPRDALGRPLPPGTPGVPTTDEGLVLAPAEALAEAQRLLDAGRPFHAHEVLEGAWKAAPDTERELWRGLAQLAVGLTHARRGNPAGAARLLHRAADRIEPYGTAAAYRTAADHQAAANYQAAATDPQAAANYQAAAADYQAATADYQGAAPHGVAAAALTSWSRGLAGRIAEHGLVDLDPAELSPRLVGG